MRKHKCIIDRECIETADALIAMFNANPDAYSSTESAADLFQKLDGSDSSVEYVNSDDAIDAEKKG